jgi:four helix bundle protein
LGRGLKIARDFEICACGMPRAPVGRHEHEGRSASGADGGVCGGDHSIVRDDPRLDGDTHHQVQLIDAATSVAANYRAACRARSRAEFIAKIGLVREEADEAHGWLCMLVNIGAVKESAAPHIKEANELTAIFSASYLTARRRGKPKPHQ